MSRENMLGWTVAHPKRPNVKYGRIVAVVKNVYPDGHRSGVNHWVVRRFVGAERYPSGEYEMMFQIQVWRGP